ncbi:hypothetical protein [sulfur-oxidizing endosymbiont of Gigantopelta aegis]|uniref:hypothetical protein n=1 Tax=sulfur-oxidizing endosymbiont of Gigantopelta aegis TaxID=2794934 RepID=UPI001BE40113|nr:hypothetical protein [sulfur-oxidizing endosymbiont of Gigantopelta aegis]
MAPIIKDNEMNFFEYMSQSYEVKELSYHQALLILAQLVTKEREDKHITLGDVSSILNTRYSFRSKYEMKRS